MEVPEQIAIALPTASSFCRQEATPLHRSTAINC